MSVGGRILRLALAAACALAGLAAGADDDERLAAQVEKIDAKFLRALGTLAQEYDKLKDPEAAHFFAECALGFGLKDPKITVIKGAYETDLYVGKLRGGVVLKAVNPIKRELQEPAKEYKKIYDEILSPVSRVKAQKEGFPEARRRILHDVAVKYEIAQGAHEYVQAIQRFNELRRAMGLRAILWEFESSRKLILAGAYMGETGDFRVEKRIEANEEAALHKESFFYSECIRFAKNESSRMPYDDLPTIVHQLRPSALLRQDLLNPDARRLWLGRWIRGSSIPWIILYRIPPIEYRPDVPTPSRRYAGETVIEDFREWVDVEDTVAVGGRKIPFVRYPYANEVDAPCQLVREHGWAESEKKFLSKAGLPIMIRFFGKCQLEDPSGKLTEPTGCVIPFRLYRDSDPRVWFHVAMPTILLVPERELEKDTKYTVTVTCTLDGTPFERTWSFTTRAK